MKRIYSLFFITIFIDIIFIFILRMLRPLFPIPQIGPEKIIGYAQYFKYPLYFDNVVFFVFILIPFASVFLMRKWLKNEKNI